MKTEGKQPGKQRLSYVVSRDLYIISDGNSIGHLPDDYTSEYFDTKQLCEDKVVELGMTLK